LKGFIAWHIGCNRALTVNSRAIAKRTATVQEIALQILGYLAENPDACDSAQGIADWWLPSLPARPRRLAVERALAALVAEGWLTASRGMDADAHTRYRLAAGRREGIAVYARRRDERDSRGGPR
jgi:hypothetical protein